MREIDEKVMYVSKDKKLIDDFIKENEFFILRQTSKIMGKYISKDDDEWSVALLAFSEAVSDYSFSKGSFFSFAELVMRRRLIDYIRKKSKYDCEISIDPQMFYSEPIEDNQKNTYIKSEVLKNITDTPDNSLKDEIEAVTVLLSKYGFSFYDLINCSPKTEKTKIACAKVACYIIKNTVLLHEIRTSKTLPLKIIEKNIKVPRKTLERHRKYIIAAVEIITGDYPHLAEYMHFIRKELDK